MRQAKVYALMDPRNNHDIYYVGGTVQLLEDRLKDHIWASTRKTSKNYPVHIWIRSLISEGIKPTIEILCYCDNLNYDVEETAWIDFCWTNGHPLTNVKSGGQSGSVGRVDSILTRQRKSKANTGKKTF